LCVTLTDVSGCKRKCDWLRDVSCAVNGPHPEHDSRVTFCVHSSAVGTGDYYVRGGGGEPRLVPGDAITVQSIRSLQEVQYP